MENLPRLWTIAALFHKVGCFPKIQAPHIWGGSWKHSQYIENARQVIKNAFSQWENYPYSIHAAYC